MKQLRILAVDDEPLALRRLKLLLNNMAGVEQIGEAGSCAEAVRQVSRQQPDILLLDIQMRDGSGFDVIGRLDVPTPPAVIFVSAFDHFALRAFETSAVDYVLKPVELARLEEAIGRARHRIATLDAEQQLEEMRLVIASLRAGVRVTDTPQYETELWIRKNVSGFARVPIESILWVSSEDDYVRVHTEGSSYLLRGSIRGLEARLDPGLFTRIHRRTLVRTQAIRELRKPRFGGLEVVMQNGEQLPAGRVYARALTRKIVECPNDRA